MIPEEWKGKLIQVAIHDREAGNVYYGFFEDAGKEGILIRGDREQKEVTFITWHAIESVALA